MVTEGLIGAVLICAGMHCCYASPLIEDSWMIVEMRSVEGNRISAESNGQSLTALTLWLDGERIDFDVQIARDLEFPNLNSARLLGDGNGGKEKAMRLLTIGFGSWRGQPRDDLDLVVEYVGRKMARAFLILKGDLDHPIHELDQRGQ